MLQTFSVGMLGIIVSRKVVSGVLATKTAYDSSKVRRISESM